MFCNRYQYQTSQQQAFTSDGIPIDKNLQAKLEQAANRVANLSQKLKNGEIDTAGVLSTVQSILIDPDVPQKFKAILAAAGCLLKEEQPKTTYFNVQQQDHITAAQDIIQTAANALARASIKVDERLNTTV